MKALEQFFKKNFIKCTLYFLDLTALFWPTDGKVKPVAEALQSFF